MFVSWRERFRRYVRHDADLQSAKGFASYSPAKGDASYS
jgi:hypothetical protein